MHPFFAMPSSNLASPEDITASLSDNVYVSIDLDVFDPSIVPAVGTPEPGGMQWHEVLNLLRSVTLHKRVIGFDVVELCPKEGHASCAFLAAKLAYKLIGYAIT
jgi:agmatinase